MDKERAKRLHMNKSNLKKVIACSPSSLTVVGFTGFVEKQTLYKTFQGAEISIEIERFYS